ncbi:MAG TPA: hypothetical protein VN901_25055 [Candidatus Acidoferrales bacterium]|nr:hypothetical protein [Candidatus Acidoferrales bacterium]
MAGKTPKEAIDNFANYFKESLSCVTEQWITAFQESRNLFKLTCNPPAKLNKRAGGNLFLIATQVLTTVTDPANEGCFKAKTREYSYRLVETEDIAAADIVAYHWHPNDSEVRTPHLHIPAHPRVHFPTSRVCLEDFILMLIKYFYEKVIKVKGRRGGRFCPSCRETLLVFSVLHRAPG